MAGAGRTTTARRVNTVVARLLRSPFARLLGPSMLLLDLNGRRTGRRHRVPLQYARGGDALWVLVGNEEHESWWRNLADEQPVGLWLHGHRHSGRARVVSGTSDPDLASRGRRAYSRRFPATMARLGSGVAHTVFVRILLSDADTGAKGLRRRRAG